MQAFDCFSNNSRANLELLELSQDLEIEELITRNVDAIVTFNNSCYKRLDKNRLSYI